MDKAFKYLSTKQICKKTTNLYKMQYLYILLYKMDHIYTI